MDPLDSTAAPLPVVVPVTLIVLDVPAQSVSVSADEPADAELVIFSNIICAMTVELLCCRFLPFVPMAMGIKTAHPKTPVISTKLAIISSIRDMPHCLDRLVFRISSMSCRSTSRFWCVRLLLPPLRPSPIRLHLSAYLRCNTRNTLSAEWCTSEA